MRVLFLNQYFPPDPAPTGILLRQVGDALRDAGHRVDYAATAQKYLDKRRGGRRLVREIGGLWQILQRGLSAERPDIVFSASSPPCLLAAATVVAKRHRAMSVHWAMDLYPELASALGEIPPLVAAVAGRIMTRVYRKTDLVVGLDADMVGRLAGHGVRAEAIRPWILGSPEIPVVPAPEPSAPMWLYSGNLGRAHEWRTLLDAQAILEARNCPARLVFQGDGPSREPARAYSESLGLQRCDWVSYAPEDKLTASLLRADVLVATQRPETRGLLWPSKLALLRRLPRPLLWIGPTSGAVASELRSRGATGIFAPGEAQLVADWLQGMFQSGHAPSVSGPLDMEREEGLRWWIETLEELSASQ